MTGILLMVGFVAFVLGVTTFMVWAFYEALPAD